MRPGPILAVVTLAVLATACPPPAPFIWADRYRASSQGTGEYVLAAGDLVSVGVYNQDSMGAKVRVRGDGRISLPLLGEVEAAGITPKELARQVQARLKEYVVNPVVTVAVEESRPLEVYVIGQVAHPGRYQLDPTASVLQALAVAGGLTPFADEGAIFVIRRERPPARIRFRLDQLTRGEGEAAAFRLRAGDTVVVE